MSSKYKCLVLQIINCSNFKWIHDNVHEYHTHSLIELKHKLVQNWKTSIGKMKTHQLLYMIWRHFRYFKNWKKQWNHWLHYFICAFEYYIFIILNWYYFTCFHNILERASCKDIIKTYSIRNIWTLKHGKPNTHNTCFGSCQCGYTHFQQMVIEGLDHSMANVNAQLHTQYVWFKKSICPLKVSLQLGCNQYCKYTIPKTFTTMCHNLEIACPMLKLIYQQLENTKIQHLTWFLEILLVSLEWGESFHSLHNVVCRRLVILKDKM
jgi:hypothetical protein